MRSPLAFALCALALAGCAAPVSPPAGDAPEDLTPAFVVLDVGAPCERFCEPNVAVMPGGEWVVLSGPRIFVSDDEGARFAEVASPPFPTAGAGGRGDGHVSAAPDGTLIYSAIVAACVAAPCASEGIQVARSTDLGASWTETMLGAPLHPEVVGADRQWVSFGPEGEVCVNFQLMGAVNLLTLVPTGHEVRVSCSTDGGASFPPFVAASPDAPSIINGPAVFDAEGRMLIPYFAGGELHVAVSEDGARTFVQHRVQGGSGAMFPTLAVGADGRLHAGWRDPDLALRYAVSEDGGSTWSEPIPLTSSGEEAPVGPWLETRNGTLLAAWFVEDPGGTNRLVFRDGERTFDLASGLERSSSRSPATDFPHFALTADGRALVPFVDLANGTTRLAVVS